jgi:hypothetical protein
MQHPTTNTYPPRTTLLSLPDELLLEITTSIAGPNRTRTLAALSLTSARLRRIADPLLYSHIQMRIGAEDLLTRTLRKRRNLRDQMVDVGDGCAVTIWFGEERAVGRSAWGKRRKEENDERSRTRRRVRSMAAQKVKAADKAAT